MTVHTDDDSLRVAAPVDVVIATLAPIVDNAVRHARSGVELLARGAHARVLITVGGTVRAEPGDHGCFVVDLPGK